MLPLAYLYVYAQTYAWYRGTIINLQSRNIFISAGSCVATMTSLVWPHAFGISILFIFFTLSGQRNPRVDSPVVDRNDNTHVVIATFWQGVHENN